MLGLPAKVAVAAQAACPNLTAGILSIVNNRVLPEEGGIGTAVAKGRESRGGLDPAITTLADRAAAQNNELHAVDVPSPAGQGGLTVKKSARAAPEYRTRLLTTRRCSMAKTLTDLFINELQDAYNAETQLTKALPKMAKAATSADLRARFELHKELNGRSNAWNRFASKSDARPAPTPARR